MDQAKPDEISAPRWRRILGISGEVFLILIMLGLIGAFLAPVIKGSSPDVRKQMEAAQVRQRTAATAPSQGATTTQRGRGRGG